MKYKDLEFEDAFKDYLMQTFPFASELSTSELKRLRDAYDESYRATKVWNNTMTMAIRSIGSKSGIDWDNDINKAAANQNMAAYNLGAVASEVKLAHGYVEEKGNQR